ncbi:hypothetical protein ACHAPT_010095 [Fusarium lateritium]
MAGFIEFYITCNPPLLPEGVSLVMTDLQDALGPSKVLEILYDPQVPWFKVIAFVEYQAEILQWMQSRLEQLLEDEVGAIDQDPDQEDELDIEEPGAQPDVDILTENPHIISWPVFSEELEANVGKYDAFRFPQHIQELPFKTVWRGLEEAEGVTISDLISKFDVLWPASDAQISLQKLQQPGNLQVTYNCSETLAYIGTELDAQSLETVIRKLDTLLSLMDAPFTKESHLILAEAMRPFRLSYRCLTHTGLSNLTYVNPAITFGADQERKLIEGAASLRVVSADARGRLSLDPTVYPLEPKLAKDPKSGFRPFAQYEYTDKRSGTSASKDIRSIPQAPRQQQAMKKTPQSSQHATKTPKTKKRVPDNLIDVGEESEEFEMPDSPRADRNRKLKETGLEGLLFSGPNGESWQGSRSPLPTETTVARWINDIKNHGAGESQELIPDLSEEKEVQQHDVTPDMTASAATLVDCGLLNSRLRGFRSSFGQTPDNDEAEQSELLSFDEMASPSQSLGVQAPRLRPGDDFDPGLLDSEPPVKMFHGMFASVDPFFPKMETGSTQDGNARKQPKTLSPEENLMDYLDGPVHMPSLMDNMNRNERNSQPGKENKSTAGDSPSAVFGKQADMAKEFFQTMRQKAAPPATWASIASKKKDPEGSKENAPFGQNVRVTVVPALPKPTGSEKKHTTVNVAESQALMRKAHAAKDKNQSGRMDQGLLPVSGDTSLPVSPKRVVPGMEPETPEFIEGLEVVAKAVEELRELVRILQVTPGLIHLEAKLGRLCFKNQPPSLVNIGNGPAWSEDSVLHRLNSNEGGNEGTAGFYTILTTNGAEADLLSQLTACKASWMLSEKQVYYEVVCKSQEGAGSLVVKVDAESFKYECLPATQELSCLYVHCAKRAWDVKFAITRMDLEAVPEAFKAFAESLVHSLSVSTKDTGEIEITAEPDTTLGWEIDRANIRHLAKYRNGPKGRSCLTITMTRIVKKLSSSGNKSKAGFRGQTIPMTPPGQGSPAQWFEANISSTRAEELFEENLGLEFGERTRWTPEKLMGDGALSALCEPALKMATKMDQVGETNRIAQSIQTTGGQAYGTIDSTRDGKPEYEFW